jgi:RNA polymerase sigma factor (sigma-70 family)
MNRRDRELTAYDRWLRRLARRLAPSRARADDLVQDTYVVALRKAPPDDQLRPWFRAVMRKLAWGQRRGERRRADREAGFSLTAPALTLADALLDHGVDRERLTAALARLPEPFQSTIVQRFLQGRSCADIARREHVPAGTVRWRQSRGLELLRAELVPRRQRTLWLVPILGASGRLIAGLWQAAIARAGGKTLWVWLAAVAAVVYAIQRAGQPPPGEATGEAVAQAEVRDDGSMHRAIRAATFGRGADGELGRGATRGAGSTAGRIPRQPAAAAGEPNPAHHADALASRDAVETHRDDCAWDPANGWRCPDATPPADAARCAAIRRQILAIDAAAQASPGGRSFLAAARAANRALAQQLGCPPIGDAVNAPTRSGAAGGRSCVTELGSDGATCTTCTDADGDRHSDCPSKPRCQSTITEAGLVCTSCDDRPGPPDCMAAQCMIENRCLQCTDPTGRVATDCSVDYERFPSASFTSSPTGSFSMAACTFAWGTPGFSQDTCNFPGTSSCELTMSSPDWQCQQCSYPDGSGGGICSTPDDAEDPFADRPADLPPPGGCITEPDTDGLALCTTCTHDDMSATRSCRYPAVTRCEFATDDPLCEVRCTLPDGATMLLCPSPSGPVARIAI